MNKKGISKKNNVKSNKFVEKKLKKKKKKKKKNNIIKIKNKRFPKEDKIINIQVYIQ